MSNKLWAVAGIVAVGVVLAGCGSGSATEAKAPVTTPAPTTTTQVATTLAPAPVVTIPPTTTVPPVTPAPTSEPQTTYAALDGAYYFSSPDGQFQCGIVVLSSRTEAGCQGVTTPVPPRPEDCMISWGNGIRVTNDGPAGFMCSGGAVYTSGGETIDPPLAVGSTLAEDGFTCVSAADGISCTNDATGHGFRIAADSNDTF